MSQLGIGTIIHYLSGGSKESADKYYGREIVKAQFKDDALTLTFSDRVKVRLTDNGQSCCESRYMTCDDKPSDLIGGHLREISLRHSETEDEYHSVHEICFVKVETEKAHITIETHNEHNGYYGGFGLNLEEVKS